MDNLSLAKNILQRMNKTNADSPYADMPPAYDSTDAQQLSAKFGNEAINIDDEHNLRTISLGRKLLSLDTHYFGISKKAAARLAEYIERNEDTVLEELKLEYGQKIKEFYAGIQELKSTQPTDYDSEISYERVVAERYKQLKDFESKVNYIAEVIRTVEEFQDDADTPTQEKQSKKFQEDFDFSFIHTFWNEGYQPFS